MRIYLDACCLNRAFDDQTQQRVRLETEAIDAILDLCLSGRHAWITSAAVEEELERDPDEIRKSQTLALLADAFERATPSPATRPRVLEIIAVGVSPADALHLALAEEVACDVLLSTDDGFVQRAARLRPPSAVRLQNPLEWWMENAR